MAYLALAFWVALIGAAYLYGVRVGVRGIKDKAIAHGRAQADSEWARQLENGMI